MSKDVLLTQEEVITTRLSVINYSRELVYKASMKKIALQEMAHMCTQAVLLCIDIT